MRRMAVFCVLSGILVLAATVGTAWAQGIVGSKHDLSSVTGPGPVQALDPGHRECAVVAHVLAVHLAVTGLAEAGQVREHVSPAR